mgnify:CR=1 FL=1
MCFCCLVSPGTNLTVSTVLPADRIGAHMLHQFTPFRLSFRLAPACAFLCRLRAAIRFAFACFFTPFSLSASFMETDLLSIFRMRLSIMLSGSCICRSCVCFAKRGTPFGFNAVRPFFLTPLLVAPEPRLTDGFTIVGLDCGVWGHVLLDAGRACWARRCGAGKWLSRKMHNFASQPMDFTEA